MQTCKVETETTMGVGPIQVTFVESDVKFKKIYFAGRMLKVKQTCKVETKTIVIDVISPVNVSLVHS